MLRGMIEAHRGDLNAAASWHRHSLELNRDAPRGVTVLLSLIGMAADHHRRGDDETAAVVLACARTIQARYNYVIPAYMPHSGLEATLADRLGEEAWIETQQRGASLTVDKVIDLALS
jgi:hypothetical protein